MTQREKLIAKMRARPVEARVEDVQAVLEALWLARQDAKGQSTSRIGKKANVPSLFRLSVGKQ